MSTGKAVYYSTYDTDWLAARVSSIWGWRQVTCEFWSRGVNDTFRVSTPRRRGYLRVSRHRWRTRREIEDELALLGLLSRHDVSVPRPVRRTHGGYITSLAAPEGRRHAVLFQEAPGCVPVGRSYCDEFGQLAASLHSVTEQTQKQFQRPAIDWCALVHRPLQAIEPHLRHRQRDYDYLRGVSRDLIAAVEATLPGQTGLYWGMCHGDLHRSNLVCDTQGQLTLLDFDCCGYGWRAYDVAAYRWSRMHGFAPAARADATKQWNAFIRGYRSVRQFEDAELRAVDYFVPLRSLWVMGLNTSLQKDFGLRTWGETYFDGHLAFIRNWLAMLTPRVAS